MTPTVGTGDPGPQSYAERQPVAALAGLVSAVWIQRVSLSADPYTHHSIPNGGVELLCQVGSVPRIVGPLTRPVVEVLEPGTTVVGLRFRPGAAAPVLGVPASDLVDLTVESHELWGSSAVALAERIDGRASPEDALADLQREIVGRLPAATGPDPLVAEAVRRLMPWRADDVGSLTSLLSVSERQLRRRCRSAVGVAPKTLHRMLRFQGFLALAQLAMSQGRAPTEDGLGRLAADAGYADQSHLTRECLRLTSRSPRVFLRETERQCGCGHDHAASFTPLLRARSQPRHLTPV